MKHMDIIENCDRMFIFATGLLLFTRLGAVYATTRSPCDMYQLAHRDAYSDMKPLTTSPCDLYQLAHHHDYHRDMKRLTTALTKSSGASTREHSSCTNMTCPVQSRCFESSNNTTLCRCNMGLVYEGGGGGRQHCLLGGREIFVVKGLVLMMSYVNQYANTSLVEFVEKATHIENGLNIFMKKLAFVIGTQVIKIKKKSRSRENARDVLTVDFIINTNTTSVKTLEGYILRGVANGSLATIKANATYSQIVVAQTDICRLRGCPCDRRKRTTCVYNRARDRPSCICREGLVFDEGGYCMNEDDTMEVEVVIPVCIFVVLFLCLSGFIYHRRTTNSNKHMGPYRTGQSTSSTSTFTNEIYEA